MDYPNLAAKVKTFTRGDLRRSGERTKVPVSFYTLSRSRDPCRIIACRLSVLL